MEVHRCRFVPFNPQGINALEFSHPPGLDISGQGARTLRLAVGRANGDIEIWNPLRGAWFQETILRGGKDRSIEGLAWTLDPPTDDPSNEGRRTKIPGRLRLFSIGYSTTVTEWDLEKGRPCRHSSGGYGEIWCLTAQPRWKPEDGKENAPAEGEYVGQHLAVGCADGSIVILSTADGDLSFVRRIRPSTTKNVRVLSLAFQNRHVLAAGYADGNIRLFDIRGGRLLRTASLGRGPYGGPKEILVWSLKCLPDGTIVSGDSTGEIRFWDSNNYSLVQRFKGHQADVLDVAVSADGESVISGGADQRTVLYRRTPGKKDDKSRRWVEVMHRRYHTHDVKKIAVYETKDISIAVSGGPDAALVVVPLREHGKEHHRKLSNLPQIPQVISSPSSRLIASFWEREVRIWRIARKSKLENLDLKEERHKLVGRVLIKGEENISSVALSQDGSLLAVATVSSIQIFSLRQPTGPDNDILRISDVTVPSEISDDGAHILSISPDNHWLCIIRPDSSINVARIRSSQDTFEIDSGVVELERSERDKPYRDRASFGTLGSYERTIRTVAFSHDSKILATGDLLGCVDFWVLEDSDSGDAVVVDHENASVVDSEDGDEEPLAIDGQRWKRHVPMPRLHSAIVHLCFRPGPTQSKARNNGNTAATGEEDRLLVVTSKHQLVEYEVLRNRFSDWSLRNPRSHFPVEFTSVKDRVMGGVCSARYGANKVLFYGSSWMWIFDLTKDYPPPKSKEGTPNNTDVAKASSSSRKRKRKNDEDYEALRLQRAAQNSGAGDLMPSAEATVSLGTKIRKIVGKDEEKSEIISLHKERPKEDDDGDDADNSNPFLVNGEPDFARLRREADDAEDAERTNQETKGDADENDKAEGTDAGSSTDGLYWHSYKFRDILGVVPIDQLSSERDRDDEQDGVMFEVAVVERPTWDVELPDRYAKDYE